MLRPVTPCDQTDPIYSQAEAAADEARKKSKALKLQLLNVREAQEAAAKKQQDLDVVRPIPCSQG
jgi:hypothetical protein